MTLKQSIAIGLVAALPFAALAQHSPAPADPVNDKATVPALTYESVFAGYLPVAGADDEVTPDKRWRAANTTVAQSEGHAGHGTTAPKPPATPANETQVDHSKH